MCGAPLAQQGGSGSGIAKFLGIGCGGFILLSLFMGAIGGAIKDQPKQNSAPVQSVTQAQVKNPAQEKAEADKRQREAREEQARQKKAAAQEKAARKSEAVATVKTFTEFQDSFKGHMLVYFAILKQMDSGAIDAATGYNQLEKLYYMSLSLFEKAGKLEVPEKYGPEKESMVNAAVSLKCSIGEAMKYLDDKKVSTLAEAQKDLQDAMKGNELVSIGVAAKAVADGWQPPKGGK